MRRLLLCVVVVTWGVAVACSGYDSASSAVEPEASAPAPEEASAAPPPDDSPPDSAAVVAPLHPVQIAAGGQMACALLADGTVWCWGSNTYGQLGPPLSDATRAPGKVQGIDSVASIAVGNAHVCALKNDSSVWCWGRNFEGELGRPAEEDPMCGSSRCNPIPTQIPRLAASQIVAGDAMGCAVSPPHGEVTCWGRNKDGQCGKKTGASLLPTVVAGIRDVTRMKLTFDGGTVCALLAAGTVSCWGSNDQGQLGHTPGKLDDETTGGGFSPVPHIVTKQPDGTGAPFDNVTDIVSGETSCALRSDGTVWCWGRNAGNELNLAKPDVKAHPTPVQIAPIVGARAIAGGRALCALVGNDPWCWGPDVVASGGRPGADAGCVNTGNTPAACYPPLQVPSPPLAMLTTNASLAFGLTLTGGGAVGWGANVQARLGHPFGGAGDDPAGNNVAPTPVLGLPPNP